MAYSVDDIGLVEAWTATNYSSDDIALDVDVTTCMTNGTVAEDCDEWKEGTINGRIEILVPPSAITAFSIQFYLNSIMTAGDSSILPYTDANSVSTTNQDIATYDTAASWVDHGSLGSSFIAELGDLGGKCAVRWASNDGAKSKLGEVQADVTYTMLDIDGITKDKDGVALPSCEVADFTVLSEGPPTTYVFAESLTSHGTTGAYQINTFGGVKHMIYAVKDNTPHVFDATDNVLVGV